jgi:hypothetical protein
MIASLSKYRTKNRQENFDIRKPEIASDVEIFGSNSEQVPAIIRRYMIHLRTSMNLKGYLSSNNPRERISTKPTSLYDNLLFGLIKL